MRMKRVLALLTFLISVRVAAQVRAVAIPQGYDFPGDAARLLGYRDHDDIPNMRLHAWNVFAGMTQPAPGGEAIWETWYSTEETFAPGPVPQGTRRVQRRFRNPRQFGKVTPGPTPQAIGASLLSFVLFNADARAHIRTNHLYQQSQLTAINSGFDEHGTPTKDRQITPFPPKAVVLKTVWWLVTKQGMTAIPVWDNDPARPDAQGNDYPTWKRVVAVDPTRTVVPPNETTTINFRGVPRAGTHVVPLASFYSFAITTADLPAIRNVGGFETATVGDYAVLVAMHSTTKEIPDWVWATFWWHDHPNDGPFASDRPAAVTGVWRNYLMNVAYSADTPKEADNTPHICFNPWLEARFRGGMASNCMSCHQRSVWTSVSFLPVTRGSIPPDDQSFAGKTKLDFLWSLGFEAR